MKRKSMSPAKRFSVWRRDGFRCTYCGRDAMTEPVTLEVDHIVPVSQGGSDDMTNLTTACAPCNWKKGPHPGRTALGVTTVSLLLPDHVDAYVRRRALEDGATIAATYRRLIRLGLEMDARREAVA